MDLLIDTQSLIWATNTPGRLTVSARNAITSGADRRYLSMVCIWEMAIKRGLKKLDLPISLPDFLDDATERMGLTELPITRAHALLVESLPHHHSDPFDRLLVAQSIIEGMPIVSNDVKFALYGVDVIW